MPETGLLLYLFVQLLEIQCFVYVLHEKLGGALLTWFLIVSLFRTFKLPKSLKGQGIAGYMLGGILNGFKEN